MAEQEHIQLIIPPFALCTDNAAMLALAIEKLRLGQTDPLELDVNPRPQRAAAHTR
jgi:N6-L-threonylcarbamoyladenine synthase